MANKRHKRLNKHMNEVNRLRRQAMQDAQAAGYNTNRKSVRSQLDAAARAAASHGAHRIIVKSQEQITMEQLDKMFGV